MLHWNFDVAIGNSKQFSRDSYGWMSGWIYRETIFGPKLIGTARLGWIRITSGCQFRQLKYVHQGQMCYPQLSKHGILENLQVSALVKHIYFWCHVLDRVNYFQFPVTSLIEFFSLRGLTIIRLYVTVINLSAVKVRFFSHNNIASIVEAKQQFFTIHRTFKDENILAVTWLPSGTNKIKFAILYLWDNGTSGIFRSPESCSVGERFIKVWRDL